MAAHDGSGWDTVDYGPRRQEDKRAGGADWATEEDIDEMLKVLRAPPYNRVSDRDGHSSPVGGRVPPEIARQLSIIAADPATPYRTESDCFRDAIYMFIEITRIRGKMPIPESKLIQLDKRMVRLETITAMVLDLHDKVDNLSRLGLNGHADELRRHIVDAMQGLTGEDQEYVAAIIDGQKTKPDIEPVEVTGKKKRPVRVQEPEYGVGLQ
jgi:hypothetical protein